MIPEVNDVREFINTSKSDFAIQSVIDFIAQAESCLVGLGLDDNQITLTMIYAVAHQVTLMDGGQVTSERNISGNALSWAAPQGTGLSSTTFGQMLKSMPGASCIESLINKSDIQVFSVGRRCS